MEKKEETRQARGYPDGKGKIIIQKCPHCGCKHVVDAPLLGYVDCPNSKKCIEIVIR